MFVNKSANDDYEKPPNSHDHFDHIWFMYFRETT